MLEPELEKLLVDISALPYGRNSDRANYLLVPLEQKGTCSTKHAYVKHLALQKNWIQVKLFIGIYMMNGLNTAGVETVLTKYELKELPEAHTYLKINGTITDITGLNPSEESFEKTLQVEKEITPDQIGDFKLDFHKSFISEWSQNTKFSTEKLWSIREECISCLSDS